jgi:hypothetical protein
MACGMVAFTLLFFALFRHRVFAAHLSTD